MKRTPIEIRDFAIRDFALDENVGAAKLSAFQNNPFADTDATIAMIAGFCGGEEAGREYVFPLQIVAGGMPVDVLSGSTLFVDPRFRRSGLGMELPELRWQHSPSKVALGASLSQMALPVHQLLDYIVFLMPRNLMLWKSRAVVEMKIKGAAAKLVEFIVDCCIGAYALFLHLADTIALAGIRVDEVFANDGKVLNEVAELIKADTAQFSEVHDARWLKWHMTESFSKDGPLRLFAARRKGLLIGFYMTKKRFHEQASHRGFKNVWLGSVVEWQVKPLYERKLKWLLVHAALKLKSEGMDAVEIPAVEKALNRFFRLIGWRQVGESNFVIKAGEGSPLFGNEDMAKIENWRLRPAMGDAGLS